MKSCKCWPLTPCILATAVVIGLPWVALAQTEDSNGSASQLSGANSLNIRNVGLRINRGNIVTAFVGHLKQFVGDCAGDEWEGSATEDNVHFISYAIPPRQDLRVKLTNQTSGKSLIKKYTQKGYGSLDFTVLSLGQDNGRQDIQYKIYNKVTNVTLETGNFSYDLTTSKQSYRRDGEWRSELFCATTNKDDLKDCVSIGGRQRLYCAGERTETIRGEDVSHRTLPKFQRLNLKAAQ